MARFPVLRFFHGVAVDPSTGTPQIIVGSALGQPAQIETFDHSGHDASPVPNPFLNDVGSLTLDGTMAIDEAIAVGGKSR